MCIYQESDMKHHTDTPRTARNPDALRARGGRPLETCHGGR